ncbi:MAG: LysE/ArgO family amino acid transporter [Endozoicomonas sp. (ex Botrylloides leachii)]|nr:LysE/ArgO family amino acid transporter [Endozoicomonas sp. (ex Botrylloides leachii)]
MIVPIGAQNAYLINQGIRRNFHILAAITCTICDVSLIAFGIFGAGELISKNATFLQIITVVGIVFLSWYGFTSFCRGFQIGNKETMAFGKTKLLTKNKRDVLLGALAVTLLNPHAYLDTVVILGGIGNQMHQELRLAFALGTFSASIIWFFMLTTTAAKFAPWLSKPPVQRTIDILVAVVMWAIAVSLVNRLFIVG